LDSADASETGEALVADDRIDSTERGGADDASELDETLDSDVLESERDSRAIDTSRVARRAAGAARGSGALGDSGLTDGREKLESEESSEDDADILSIDNDFLSKRFRTRAYDVYHSPEQDESSSLFFQLLTGFPVSPHYPDEFVQWLPPMSTT
jgi:hypothetical protein